MSVDLFHAIGEFFIVILKAYPVFLGVRLLFYVSKYFVNRSERLYAIFMHYQWRVLGRGHENDSVLTCNQGPCKLAF